MFIDNETIMDETEITDWLDQHYDDFVLKFFLSFGYHIHGFEIHGGVYQVEQHGCNMIMISVSETVGVTWGILVCYDEDGVIIFKDKPGIDTFEDIEIIKTIREPQNLVFEINNTCDYHNESNEYNYTKCDKCHHHMRQYKTNYNCSCDFDLCQKCYDEYDYHVCSIVRCGKQSISGGCSNCTTCMKIVRKCNKRKCTKQYCQKCFDKITIHKHTFKKQIYDCTCTVKKIENKS